MGRIITIQIAEMKGNGGTVGFYCKIHPCSAGAHIIFLSHLKIFLAQGKDKGGSHGMNGIQAPPLVTVVRLDRQGQAAPKGGIFNSISDSTFWQW